MTRRVYSRSFTTPDAEVIRATLPDLGKSLHQAAIDLSRDCSLERIDAMLAQLKGADAAVRHMRRAEVQESGV